MSTNDQKIEALVARRCKPILPLLKNCCQDHGESCNGDVLRLGDDDFEINLIDVRRMCLVQRNSSRCGYFTLSYVWGSVEQYRLSKSNFDFFCQEGSVDAIIGDIPQLARDAIRLVRRLRGHYLWIDSLCIVQDDAEQKHTQIAHMAQIYSRSFLTIVAVEALDANSPLPCVHYAATIKPNTTPVMGFPTDDGQLEQMLRSSKFGSRAWTYQEVLLSRRRLFSFTNLIVLQCGAGSWYSGVSQDWEIRSPEDTEMSTFPLARLASAAESSWLPSYRWVVESYSGKELSFSSDFGPAFAGIESALASLLACPFFHGLPELFFDYALLWSTPSGETPTKRRRSEPQFPSWSWMRCGSRISFPTYENIVPQNFGISLASLVESKTIVSPGGSQPVNHSYHPSPGDRTSEYVNRDVKMSQSLCLGNGHILQFYAFAAPVGLSSTGPNHELANPTALFWLLEACPNPQNFTDITWLPGSQNAPMKHIEISDVVSFIVGKIVNVDLEDLNDVFRSKRRLEIISLSEWNQDRGQNRYGNIVNVMLIQWFGEYAERIAVGQIDAIVWNISYRKCVRLA